MSRDTVFSPCRRYRYTLWREWDCDLLTGCSDDSRHAHEFVQFIGLNPSTADETKDDPTIRRCIGFAKAWGYGALCMTNLFAWRDTLPENMMKAAEPIGPENDKTLLKCAAQAGVIVAAWGKGGNFNGRGIAVCELLRADGRSVSFLKLNSDFSPAHPLYLPATLKPVPFDALK